MSATNFPACLSIILQSEGAEFDPSGPSKFGVLQSTLSSWLGHPATIGQVQALTPETVAPLYRADYFALSGCNNLANGLDLMVFDAAVQHGVGTAVRMLQRALGVAADTVFGPATAAAATSANPGRMIDAIVAARAALYQSLPDYSRFGSGWMARLYRTAAQAHGMVVAPAPAEEDPSPVIVGPGQTEPTHVIDPISNGLSSHIAITSGTVLEIPPPPTPKIVQPLAARPKKQPVVTPLRAGATVGAVAVAGGAVALTQVHGMTTVDLSPILTPLIQIAGLILTGCVGWAATRVAAYAHISTQSTALQTVLGVVDRGINYGQQVAVTAAQTDANVNVSTTAQAKAAEYVIAKAPGMLKAMGVDVTTAAGQQHVADLVTAKLPGV